MPDCLHVPEDQKRFRAALANADVTILGREGHERHPANGRSRLVLTTRVDTVELREEGGSTVVYWNPGGVSLQRALTPFGGDGPERTAAIAGGTRVMTALLPVTDRFDLVVASDCAIPDGRPCLTGAPSIQAIEEQLQAAGLLARPPEPLGTATLRVWQR